jgi:hypothetical protein
MAICCVAAVRPVLTYRFSTLRSGAQGAQCAPVEYCHGPTESALCALHLAHS